ncbi:MAG: magnesium chelatase subunit [Blastocatellia bacterium]|nr:magnesium chelatase subunit [Blastocatellia bacterium]
MTRHDSQTTHNLERRQPARPVYPFAGLVGQEEMKLALLLNAIDSSIGGVLIMGHRGTGKSTAVRALADLLPEIWRVENCLYGCDPADEASLCADCRTRLARDGRLRRERARVAVVDLPLGATEDRVCGSLDFERAIGAGQKAFEPGLLARAHRGFLYIDEVNLLEDHLIDLLLDVAATGRNAVEREGISLEHPAQFVLVGSGNPEEGELRPQLLDRFGLHVEIKTVADLDQRVRIVELREAFDRDPEAFRAAMEQEQESLRRRITRARKALRGVEVSRELLRRIAGLCLQLNIDGHRGELTITRAARALAAFEGRKRATAADVRRVATMALRHRQRRDPFEPTESGARVQQQLAELFPEAAGEQQSHAQGESDNDDRSPNTPQGGAARRTQKNSRRNVESNSRDIESDSRNIESDAQVESNSQASGESRDERNVPPTLDASLPENMPREVSSTYAKRATQARSARRQQSSSRVPANPRRGRYVRAVSTKASGARLALDATLRTAARKAGVRGWGPGVGERPTHGRDSSASLTPNPQPLTPVVAATVADLHYKSFRQKSGRLYIFAVDASGSMAANRIGQAKGALARLLRQSYVRRDRVALVSFRRERAEALLPPSRSVTRAGNLLDALTVGGTTPLAAGLACALEVAERAARQSSGQIILLLFTDGRSNVPLRAPGNNERATRERLINEELEQLGAALQRAGVETIVVDTQSRFVSGGEGLALARRVRAAYVYLPPGALMDEETAMLKSLATQGR